MTGRAQASLNVLLLLAEGFEDLEAAAVRSICGWSQYREHLPPVTVTITGLRSPIRGRFGTVVEPEFLLEDAMPREYAALVIPGGFHSHGYDEIYDARVHALARAIHAQGGVIATMCVGILPVAEAGLLAGRRATCYPHSSKHDNMGRLAELGAIPNPGPVVVDDRIISCSGPAHALVVVHLLLERLVGVESAKWIAEYMRGDSSDELPGTHPISGRFLTP